MNPETNGRPILLVEDNPVDLDLTLRAFKRRNFANPIEVARDGQEVLEMLPRWDAGEPVPLVILLDLKLPRVGASTRRSSSPTSFPNCHEKYWR